MLKSLSHDRGDRKVIVGTTASRTFSNEVVAPSSLQPGAFLPPTDLSLVIVCSPSQIEPGGCLMHINEIDKIITDFLCNAQIRHVVMLFRPQHYTSVIAELPK